MNEKIASLIADRKMEGTLFVLKGFPTEIVKATQVKLSESISNKIARLFQLTMQEEQVISFDEFVCLYDLIILQYQKIYIIENSLYHVLYPVNITIDNYISKALLSHFDDDASEDSSIEGISEYTNIYSNYLYTEQGLACCYNIDESLLRHIKIERYIFDYPICHLSEETTILEGQEYINICNDVDYFQLVQSLYYTEKIYAVTWESYASDRESMQKQIELLSACFPNRVFAYLVPSASTLSAGSTDLRPYMKRYWGYDDYRKLKIYDLDSLERGEKKVITISQECIINDLVEQVEHCVNGEPFKDIFVTAPTGAGKSLMFQLPAMYIAEKYNLVTLVITPLIGLMNDQVQALSKNGYSAARTINSDISPIIKQEILSEIATGKCHILYLSPESLLSRSDIEQLIGTRKIGMLVVDEAHIVTTWGKQFRPDYWYLGDHVQKIRRAQAKRENDPSPFIIATFTATAIYEGNEDMYHETLNSLHMIDPITYLGYVKRDNINIEIREVEVKRNKTEYEINKFDALVAIINTALMRNQKTLIYFPTVTLINRFYDYCYSKKLSIYVAKYHGQMPADEKNENFHAFNSGTKMVMLATKAFGMGIDIKDIAIVAHFAPTGNVCDYMQEIGRAARDPRIEGHAIYKHMSNDFKHINRLHGLSAIQRYQLVEVIKKILEIYTSTRYQCGSLRMTKKRNEMLIDAESFAYIFESPQSDDNDLINKVKTAMLLVQKDYENRGFAPFYMRPIPLFAYGYFSIRPQEQKEINAHYDGAVTLIFHPLNICEVNLKTIWDKSYSQTMSFPKFKYLLYTRNPDLEINQKWSWVSAMSVDIYLNDGYEQKYSAIISAAKEIVNASVYQGKYYLQDEISEAVAERASISKYRSENIVSVLIAAMDVYQREYSNRMNARMYLPRVTRSGETSYQFQTVTREFFSWLGKSYKFILENIQAQKIYVVNDHANTRCKEITTVLGVLETIGVLRFKSLGGSNSQIYIYVNETKNMQMVRDRPNSYRNKLLELINSRHEESVRMLTFLFQSKLSSDEVWEHLENYFLGILPKELAAPSVNGNEGTLANYRTHFTNSKKSSEGSNGVKILSDEKNVMAYNTWKEFGEAYTMNDLTLWDECDIPKDCITFAEMEVDNHHLTPDFIWPDYKVAVFEISDDTDTQPLSEYGWSCYKMNVDSMVLKARFRGE